MFGLFKDLFGSTSPQSNTKQDQSSAETSVSQHTNDGSFTMKIEDVFSLANRIVVAGSITAGSVQAGEQLVLVNGNDRHDVTVSSIEIFNKVVDSAKVGDTCGLLITGVAADQVVAGSLLTKV